MTAVIIPSSDNHVIIPRPVTWSIQNDDICISDMTRKSLKIGFSSILDFFLLCSWAPSSVKIFDKRKSDMKSHLIKFDYDLLIQATWISQFTKIFEIFYSDSSHRFRTIIDQFTENNAMTEKWRLGNCNSDIVPSASVLHSGTVPVYMTEISLRNIQNPWVVQMTSSAFAKTKMVTRPQMTSNELFMFELRVTS